MSSATASLERKRARVCLRLEKVARRTDELRDEMEALERERGDLSELGSRLAEAIEMVNSLTRKPTKAPRETSANVAPRHGTVAQRVMDVLRESPDGVAPSVIARETGEPLSNIGPALCALSRRGMAENPMRGVWRPIAAKSAA